RRALLVYRAEAEPSTASAEIRGQIGDFVTGRIELCYAIEVDPLRVVESVEHFQTQLEVPPLGHADFLEHRDVPVRETRASDRVTSGIYTDAALRCRTENRGIDKALQ